MYVRILPLISGYRSENDHKINFTTFYDEIIEEIGNESGELNYVETQDLEVVIPIARIVSIHLFDLKLYEHFREKPEEAGAAVQ